jgi:hypothetical protein
MVPSWLGNVLPSVLCIQVLERTEFLSPRPDKASGCDIPRRASKPRYPHCRFVYGKGEEWGVYELPETEEKISYE